MRGGLSRSGVGPTRRKFHDAISSDKTRAEEALDWIGRLYGVERAVKDEIAKRLSTLGPEPSDVERRAIDDQVRTEARDKNSREILDGFSLWLESRVVQVLPKSPLGEAIGYARSNWQALNRYLEAPWLSIDNNASERAVKPVALGRKNSYDLLSSLGARSERSCSSWCGTQDLQKERPNREIRRLIKLLFGGWLPHDEVRRKGCLDLATVVEHLILDEGSLHRSVGRSFWRSTG